MAINYPSLEEIVSRIKNDIQSILPDLDPNIPNSFIEAIVISLAGRLNDFVLLSKQLENNIFITSSSNTETIEQWAGYEGLKRYTQTTSKGNVIITGTVAADIPVDLSMSIGGNSYKTIAVSSIVNQSLSVDTLFRRNSTVYVKTTTNHNLGTGQTVSISGAHQTEYNGNHEITILNKTEFSYEITSEPTTPGVGTILVDTNQALVEVHSDGFGENQNLNTGSVLTLDNQTAGLSDSVYIPFEGILGGRDAETDLDLYQRILYKKAHPIANFNVSAIEEKAKEYSKVTRVSAYRATPSKGFVTIYFLQENEADILPTDVDIQQVKDKIVEILPLNLDEDSIKVLAPTLKKININITNLNPFTKAMRESITAELGVYFKEKTEFGLDIAREKILTIISDTINPETQTVANTFTLAEPHENISVGFGEIAVLGDISFA